MKNVKKLFAAFLSLALIISAAFPKAVEAAQPVVYLNEKQILFKKGAPYIDDKNRILVPAEEFAAALGGTAVVNGKIATITKKDLVVNSQAILENGVHYIEMRYVAEAFDYAISWDNEKGAAQIKTKPPGTIHEASARLTQALELLKYMPAENVVFSPLGIKLGMGIAANAAQADSNSFKQIKDKYNMSSLPEFNVYHSELVKGLEGSVQFDFDVSNSVWLNQNVSEDGKIAYKEDFLKTMTANYNADTKVVLQAVSADAVNKWAESRTKVPNAYISKTFQALLANTVQLKAQWENKFEPEYTQLQPFTDKNGAQFKLDFMNIKEYLSYYEDEKAQIVAKPYAGGQLQMYFVLPKNSGFDISSVGSVAAAMNHMGDKRTYVHLSVPKFSSSYPFQDSLKQTLASFGIKQIFADRAMLNQMYEGVDTDIKFDNFLHYSYFDISEGGTLTAAIPIKGITEVLVDKETPVDFVLNKPFIYYVMDTKSGEILFMGQYWYAK